MANLLDNFFNRIGVSFATNLMALMDPERISELNEKKKYYEGDQRKPLKVKPTQYDYNIVTNLIGIAVDKSVSMMFGGGCDIIAAAGEDSPEQEYINLVLDANHWEILSHRTGLDGEMYGTPYLKIVPDGLPDGMPRLVLVDPRLMEIIPDPQDMERVEQYIYEIQISDRESYREVTKRAEDGDTWIVEQWRSRGGKWNLENTIPWEYPFPPLLHWQNLPSVHSVYGRSGIEDVIAIQDRFNLVSSNISKIIGLHAHPTPYILGMPGNEAIDWGPDKLLRSSSPDTKVGVLEMQSDLSASHQYMADLRAQIFDICRVVDTASIKDKVGQLTNFGLRVLYSDAIAKNNTKRALYGAAFAELFRRVLVLNGMENAKINVEWGDDLPANEAENAATILADLNAGLVSKESASELRGYQWKTNDMEQGEQDKIAAEQSQNRGMENNALANFLSGRE